MSEKKEKKKKAPLQSRKEQHFVVWAKAMEARLRNTSFSRKPKQDNEVKE